MGRARHEFHVVSVESVEEKRERLLDRQRTLSGEGPSILLPFFDRPFDFAPSLPGPDGITAIMLFLAFGQSQFDLGLAPIRKIDAERDQREALLLCFPQELVDLLSMQEQFAGPDRVMVHNIAVAVGTDMAMMKKNFPILHTGIAVLEIHAPIAKRLDLGPPEDNPGLEFFFDEIVVVGFPIGGDDFLLIICLFCHELNRCLDLVLCYHL